MTVSNTRLHNTRQTERLSTTEFKKFGYLTKPGMIMKENSIWTEELAFPQDLPNPTEEVNQFPTHFNFKNTVIFKLIITERATKEPYLLT